MNPVMRMTLAVTAAVLLVAAPAVANSQTAQVEAARMLIAHGVDVDVNSSGGLTPLMCAAERGQNRMVRFLIEAGADVSAKGDEVFWS